MKCPRCQAENREGLRFCEDCGALLAVICSSCGGELTPGKRFCGSCGASLATAVRPEARFSSPQAYTPRHLAERIINSKAALEGERKQVTILFADIKGSLELMADPHRFMEASAWFSAGLGNGQSVCDYYRAEAMLAEMNGYDLDPGFVADYEDILGCRP